MTVEMNLRAILVSLLFVAATASAGANQVGELRRAVEPLFGDCHHARLSGGFGEGIFRVTSTLLDGRADAIAIQPDLRAAASSQQRLRERG